MKLGLNLDLGLKGIFSDFSSKTIPITEDMFFGDYWQILNEKNRHLFIKGGRGSGKTSHIIRYILYLSYLQEYKDTKFMFFRKYAKNLKGTLFASIMEEMKFIDNFNHKKYGSSFKSIFKDFTYRESGMVLKNKHTGVSFGFAGVNLMFEAVKSTPEMTVAFYDESSGMYDYALNIINQTMRKSQNSGDFLNSDNIDALLKNQILRSFYAWNPEPTLTMEKYADSVCNTGLGKQYHINYNSFDPKGMNESIFINAESLKKTDFKKYEFDYLGKINLGELTLKNIELDYKSTSLKAYEEVYMGIDPTIEEASVKSDFTAFAFIGINKQSKVIDLWGYCFKDNIIRLLENPNTLKKIAIKPKATMIERNSIGAYFDKIQAINKTTSTFGVLMDYRAVKSKVIRVERIINDNFADYTFNLLVNISDTNFIDSIIRFYDPLKDTKYHDDGMDAFVYACNAMLENIKNNALKQQMNTIHYIL